MHEEHPQQAGLSCKTDRMSAVRKRDEVTVLADPEPLDKCQVMGTTGESRDKQKTGPAMFERQPGLNGDSQRAASLCTAVEGRAEGMGTGQEVQV